MQRFLRAAEDVQITVFCQAAGEVVNARKRTPCILQYRPLKCFHIQNVSFPNELCIHICTGLIAETPTSNQYKNVTGAKEVYGVLVPCLRLHSFRLNHLPSMFTSTDWEHVEISVSDEYVGRLALHTTKDIYSLYLDLFFD